MNKVLIIGGGFAGLSAARYLCRYKKHLEVSLVDKRKEFHFLPMLPDIIGRQFSPKLLQAKIENLSRELKFNFINDRINSIDLEKRIAKGEKQSLEYDYLIIASGSETNFYGNDQIKKSAYKLDNLNDLLAISRALEVSDFDSYLVCGGGYTGIEIASNLRRYLDKRSENKAIAIVERAPSLLGSLPEWMKGYVKDNLKRLKIDVFLNCVVDSIEKDVISVSCGKIFNKAMLIWAAGVRTADLVQNLTYPKNPQGRVKVDDYLRLDQRSFVTGDSANFQYQNNFLRMAVQFSIIEGRLAAENIIRVILNRPLKKYRPVDLGYIIPMASNRSCGKVLGINLSGSLATLSHYLMCIYRSYGLKSKLGIVKHLIAGGGW